MVVILFLGVENARNEEQTYRYYWDAFSVF